MASSDSETSARRPYSPDDDRSPSPVDRRRSPSPRRGRSLSRDSRASRDYDRGVPPGPRDASRSPSRSPSRDRSPSARSPSPPPRRRSPSPRDRSRPHSHDRSPARSPPRRRSPPPARRDADRYRPPKKERTPPPVAPAKTEEEKLADARAEYQKLLNMRSQGVYLPPHKLRALQAAITDKSTKEYQRMAWDALKKSINGLVNKVNTANIKYVVPELFGENLIRGRGLFCQSLLKAQHASLPFTPIYACLAAICNTKLPQVGELLVKRLIMRFRKAFKRNDKAVCLSSTMFIAHLVNHQVVHETLAAQILLLLLAKPTDDSVEIAVGLMREVGLFLEEMSPRITNAVFDQFRNILHEADIDRRTQYMIEVLFQVRKDRYKDNPVIREELDLIEEEDQITHRIGLDEDIDTQDGLNVFKYDPDWEANEEEYKKLKAEILGEGSDEEEDDDDDDDEEESDEDEEDEEQKALEIKDQSNADLVNLRRTIYLTIQSSADPEEAAHKLMKLRLPPGQEPELVSMIVESCAQEKVYLKFMGLLGERFARINRMWMELFEESFMKYYSTIHRYETNKLRNIARFFSHLLASDAIGWHVFSVIRLTQEDTTSASRVYIKILFEDLQENMGTAKLKARMSGEALQPSFQGIFPHDTAANLRFAINYFTAIKMGFLTDEMRNYLANMAKPTLPPPVHDSDSDSVSSYSSYSSYSSRSRSPSRSPSRSRSRSRSRTPRRAIDRGRGRGRSVSRRGRSYSRSRSYTRSISTGRSPSRSPSLSRSRSRSRTRSRSPVRRRAAARGRRSISRTPSRSPSPSRTRDGRGRGRGRGRSYSRSPSPWSASRSRSRSLSRSRSPSPARRRGRSYSRSVSRSRSPSRSRSRSPPRSPSPVAGAAGAAGKRRRGGSYSPSPPPARRQRRYSRSRSRSMERGGGVPGGGGGGGGGGGDRRGRGDSYSRSLSRSRTPSRSPLPPPSPSPPPPPRGAAGNGRGGGGGRRGGGGGYWDDDRDGYRNGGYRDRGRGRGRSRSPRSPARSPAGPSGGKRRRYYSDSRSRSPGPSKRGRAD